MAVMRILIVDMSSIQMGQESVLLSWATWNLESNSQDANLTSTAYQLYDIFNDVRSHIYSLPSLSFFWKMGTIIPMSKYRCEHKLRSCLQSSWHIVCVQYLVGFSNFHVYFVPEFETQIIFSLGSCISDCGQYLGKGDRRIFHSRIN